MPALESFTFTALYGVMIENGKLANQVRGVKLTGNVFETLKNIDGVSDDFAIDEGTCGKAGQYVPVGSGGGYVRINDVTVGGE
jgi:TldD protein